MTLSKSVATSFLLLGCLFSVAQPSTEVYLFDLKNEEGKISISNPVNISSNEGYDNQPSFWPDGKSIIYARTVDGQTDIARYFLATGETKIISSTKQGSEYSPTPMPDGRISSIRLDTTGLQLLYAYDLNGQNEVLVKDLKIGYHAWLNKKELVSFVLGSPATMQVINTKSGEVKTITENIGRSLHKIPNQKAYSYVDKSSKPWSINSMSLDGEKDQLIATLADSEDYCWTPSGEMIMGQKTKLFSWSDGGEWTEFADVASQNLGEISRMAVSKDGDKLVIVVSN